MIKYDTYKSYLYKSCKKNHLLGPHGQRGGHPPRGPSGSRIRSKMTNLLIFLLITVFLSSYGTNLDLKFEAIFRKSCRGLFEEKCVFWVTDFGTSHFFLRHPVNFSRSNNYSGVAWIKKSIFTTPNVKTDNITLWATSRPKNWCGLIWCYGL